MKAIATLLSLLGKLLKFGSGIIALIYAINSGSSFWPGLGLFIVVTLVAGGIGFVMEAAGVALFAANDN